MAVAPELALHEGGTLDEYDGSGTGGTGNASITIPVPAPVPAYEGELVLAASIAQASEFARAQWNVNWVENDDVWYGAAIWLPAGFKAAAQGEVALLRWDIFGAATPRFGGLFFDHVEDLLALRRQTGGGESVDILPDLVVAPPEEQWFWVDVRQKYNRADGAAINEVWIDDQLAASSTLKNSYFEAEGPINRLRVGIAATSGNQTNPLELYLDRVYIAETRLGPIPGPEPPAGGLANAPRSLRGVGM